MKIYWVGDSVDISKAKTTTRRITRSTKPSFCPSVSFVRFSSFIVSVAIIAAAGYSASSASSAYHPIAGKSGGRKVMLSSIGLTSTLAAPAPPVDESIAIFAADCVTPKTDFNLGDTVCVKVTGGLDAARLNWVAHGDSVVQANNITSDPQTFTFTIPAGQTSTVSGIGVDDVSADNRGVWRLYTAAADNSVRAVAFFTVHDAATPYVDLSVYQDASLPATSVGANSSSVFDIFVTNNGPDDAQGVQLVDTLPANTTFVALPDSSPFTCSPPSDGTVTCTAATLAAGTTVKLTLAYQVNSGTTAGTLITNSVDVSSTTTELEPGDNTAAFSAVVPAGAVNATCTFDCQANITTTATSQSGAVVNYPSATNIVGTCGAISASPASGSIFPVGTTIVNVSSEAGTSCSFTVTVVTTPAPTIACPADKSTSAGQNGTASVDPGSPTTTPSTGVTVNGVRSDNLPLTDPYPTGETGITWTVLDSVGRTASCEQRITVLEGCPSGTPPPTITAPADVTASTGPDSTTCGAIVDLLGSATAHSDCSVTVNSSGIPAGNVFPVGTTVVTYTATDGGGQTATATQNVIVIDNTPPVIFAPANASYTCPSQVPAASPSQATGPDIGGQPGPVFDNCGSPTVTVSQTSSGAGSAASPLVITRTYTATDTHGNSASAVQTITVTDSTAPTVTAPVNAAYQCASQVPAASPSQASASDNCGAPTVTVSETTNGGAGSPASPLIITRTYTATDAAGNTASAPQTITVSDTTPPTVTPPLNAAYQCASQVPAASPSQASASDNCGAPTVTVSQTNNGGAGTPASPLIITRTYTATDAAGNTASASQTITVSDTTPPVISCPANIVINLPLNSTATSMAVNYSAPTASDNCSTPVVTSTPASGSVFPVGTTTVNATATDAAGNASTCSFTVTVHFNFTGFFPPVGNLPTLNVVNAGSAIPVKFSLSGNKGLSILAADSPQSGVIPCDASAPASDLTDTVNAGSSSLSYSSGSDQYNYVWKTESSWAGTCRQLVVRLTDGSVHVANFKFK